MLKIRAFLTALLICWALAIPAITQQHQAASQKPQPRADLPVTATITDYTDVTDDTGAVQRIFMQIRSDGAGGYTNSSNLQSIIQGASGNWYLVTANSLTRHVFLDFSKPIAGTGPDGGAPVAPFNSALIGASLISKCHLYNNDLFTIPAGTTVNCPLTIFFSDSGNDYLLQMNPVIGAYVFPETDYVNFTCNQAANGQCNNWTIEPNGARGGCVTADCSLKQNVARLNKLVPIKGKSGSKIVVNQGDFYLTFSISVTNP
ncbi:MAG: hypothetical protein AB1631_13600 [Acidobacteriota bacterium]